MLCSLIVCASASIFPAPAAISAPTEESRGCEPGTEDGKGLTHPPPDADIRSEHIAAFNKKGTPSDQHEILLGKTESNSILEAGDPDSIPISQENFTAHGESTTRITYSDGSVSNPQNSTDGDSWIQPYDAFWTVVVVVLALVTVWVLIRFTRWLRSRQQTPKHSPLRSPGTHDGSAGGGRR